MTKNTISLCMIVKDEEKVLKKCLESVRNVVDEIIIVDTGSSDQTVKIAEEFDANIYHFEWIDDFSAARNFSIKHATSDYILFLDADEYLEENPMLKQEISTNKDYYMMTIKNFVSDQDVLTSSGIRLFKNNIGLYFENRLHEHLNITSSGKNYSSERIDTIIYHTGYLEKITTDKRKHERNFRIMKKEIDESPNGYGYYNMGRILYRQKKYIEALEVLKKSYALSKTKTYTTSLINFMGLCLDGCGRPMDAISLLLDGVKVFPDYIDFYYVLGNIYKSMSYYKDAELCYKKCLSLHGIKQIDISQEGIGSFLSNYKLAELYIEQNRLDVAFDYAFESLSQNKNYRPTLLMYIKLMLQANIPLEEAYDQITQVYPISNFNDLRNLIFILYELRHPLLIKYLNEQNGIDNKENVAISLLYAGRYEEAKEKFNEVINISEKDSKDVILLSIILKDDAILSRIKDIINLSKREWNILTSIVLMQDFDFKNITLDLEKILLYISEKLIILSEFDNFQYVSGIIMNCSKKCQFDLAKMLNSYGFAEVAMELLLRMNEKFQNDTSIVSLSSDILIQKGFYSDALSLLIPLLSIVKDYKSYYQTYVCYDKLGNDLEKNKIIQEMKKLFPLSIYVNPQF